VTRDFEKAWGVTVGVVSGAVKTTRGSAPLAPIYFNGALEGAELITTEWGSRLSLRMKDMLNPGVFMDQRVNRGRLSQLIAKRGLGPLLNLFSYTGAFSVLAARRGCAATSVDLSKSYLTWEGVNHELNGTAALSRRLKADATDYLRRQGAKEARGEMNESDRPAFIVIDPPTFSRADGKVFRVQEGLPALVRDATKILDRKAGAILVSCNAMGWPMEDFIEQSRAWALDAGLRWERGATAEDVDYELNSAWLLRNL
jgi:23S rRNA (cytosine1962-C5)-methyltransferase